MKILILHNLGNPRYWRKNVAELELALPHTLPNHQYLVHNACLPLPDFVKRLSVDGIVLGPTFLCARYYTSHLDHTLREYGFIKEVKAWKIALPQDDYDCSGILDRWMTDWGVNALYPVCSQHWDILYPRFIRSGGKMELSYTGFITRDLIRRSAHPRPHSTRGVDVFYRASRLHPHFGRIGQIKSDIAEKFSQMFSPDGLSLDISTSRNATIFGNKWLQTLENARFTLGTNSGSSIWDPEGKIRQKVKQFVATHPDASFSEVEKVCFPGEDGKYEFTALSPRNLEAGMLLTGQILVPGAYSGILHPWEHYVPISENCENHAEVLDAIRNLDLLERISSKCREQLLSRSDLRLDYHAQRLLQAISESIPSSDSSYSASFAKAVKRHTKFSNHVSKAIWFWQEFKRTVHNHPVFGEFLKRILTFTRSRFQAF